jgi:hypothetical protein
MELSRHALLGIGMFLLGTLAPDGAFAQADKWDKPIDLKPLIPPVLPPLPPNSQLSPGAVGGMTPYSNAPTQSQSSTSQPAPGIKFTVPSR